MTRALILYTDEVRAYDVDADRADVLRNLVDDQTLGTMELPELGLVLMFGASLNPDPPQPLNLPASLLVAGYFRRPSPVHPIAGTVVLLGRTVDGEIVDVEGPFLGIFPGADE